MTTRWTDREADTRRRYNRYTLYDILLAALTLIALLVLGGMR